MHARFFSPTTGRFLSVDPLAASAAATMPQTWNRYAYVAGSPLKFVDPRGTNAIVSCAADSCVAKVEAQIIVAGDSSTQNSTAQAFKLGAESYWNSVSTQTASGKLLTFDVSMSVVDAAGAVDGMDTFTVVDGPGVANVKMELGLGSKPDSGTIFTQDATGNPTGMAGIGAHETGHLMGLRDLPDFPGLGVVTYSPGPQVDIMKGALPSNGPLSAHFVANTNNPNSLVLGHP